MIRLVGIAKGLNRKINEQPDYGDTIPDTELAQEYAADLSKVIEQLEALEEEMAREFDNKAMSTQDVSYNQQSNQMSRYISQASKNIEKLMDMLERYS